VLEQLAEQRPRVRLRGRVQITLLGEIFHVGDAFFARKVAGQYLSVSGPVCGPLLPPKPADPAIQLQRCWRNAPVHTIQIKMQLTTFLNEGFQRVVSAIRITPLDARSNNVERNRWVGSKGLELSPNGSRIQVEWLKSQARSKASRVAA